MENVNTNETENTNVAAADNGGGYQGKAEEFIAQANAEFLRWMKEGKYPDIIAAMENLGKYTLRNMMLILSQNPEATNVAGMREWNYHGRSILSGQKAMKVLAPRLNDGKLVEDGNGQAQYKVNTVFDVSQTQGKDLKQTRCTPEFIEQNYDGIKAVIVKLANDYSFIENSKRNSIDYAKKEVSIKEGLSREDILKAMIYSAAAIHCEGKDREVGKDVSQGKQMFNEIEETAVANIVCRRMGLGDYKLKTLDFSESDEASIEKFANNLHHIRGLSQKFINNIEQFVSDIESGSAAAAQAPATDLDDSGLRDSMMNDKPAKSNKKSKQAEKGGMEL